MKNILTLFLCFGLAGCASIQRAELSQEYLTVYNNALNSDTGTTITKHENYQTLKKRLSGYLTSHGYTAVLFVDPQEGFIVLGKEGDIHPSQIILKYTGNIGVNTIRIDLVRGSNDLATNHQVSQDIQEIAELINNG